MPNVIERGSMVAVSGTTVILADEQCEVKFMSRDFAADDELRRLICEGTRLSTTLQESLRIFSIHVLDLAEPRVIPLDDRRVIRCSRLLGSGSDLLMLVVEANRDVDALTLASARFSLTRRKTTVLELILEGANARAIGEALEISEHTVHAYMKRLVAKTDTRNRASMVAAVLNWDRSRVSDRHKEKEKAPDGGVRSPLAFAKPRA